MNRLFVRSMFCVLISNNIFCYKYKHVFFILILGLLIEVIEIVQDRKYIQVSNSKIFLYLSIINIIYLITSWVKFLSVLK